MKNLENYGVQELNAGEIREINGGSWLLLALFVVIAIIFAKDGNSNTATRINGNRIGN